MDEAIRTGSMREAQAIANRYGFNVSDAPLPSQSEDSAPARVVPMRLFAGIDAKPSAIRQVLAVVGMKLEPNALDELQDKASAPEGKREERTCDKCAGLNTAHCVNCSHQATDNWSPK